MQNDLSFTNHPIFIPMLAGLPNCDDYGGPIVLATLFRRLPAIAAGLIAALFWANTGVLSLAAPAHLKLHPHVRSYDSVPDSSTRTPGIRIDRKSRAMVA